MKKGKALAASLVLIMVLLLTAGFDSKGTEHEYITVFYQAERELSGQEALYSADVIRQRMADRNIDGSISWDGSTLVLTVRKENGDETTLGALTRRGHLSLTDREGNTLIDNSGGTFIESAKTQVEGTPAGIRGYNVKIRFKSEYMAWFAEITEANMGNSLPVVLDDEICASPVVQSKITEGEFVMTGLQTEKEAGMITEIWESQCLPAEFTRVEKK